MFFVLLKVYTFEFGGNNGMVGDGEGIIFHINKDHWPCLSWRYSNLQASKENELLLNQVSLPAIKVSTTLHQNWYPEFPKLCDGCFWYLERLSAVLLDGEGAEALGF